jgi:hypothetical protein
VELGQVGKASRDGVGRHAALDNMHEITRIARVSAIVESPHTPENYTDKKRTK